MLGFSTRAWLVNAYISQNQGKESSGTKVNKQSANILFVLYRLGLELLPLVPRPSGIGYKKMRDVTSKVLVRLGNPFKGFADLLRKPVPLRIGHNHKLTLLYRQKHGACAHKRELITAHFISSSQSQFTRV